MGCSTLSLHHLLFSSLFIFSLLLNQVHATKKCYIVYLGTHSHGPTPSSADLQIATSSHYDLLASILGSEENAKEAIIYSYNKQINGFAAMLQEEEAAQIAKNEKVVSVFLVKEHKLHTTRSWDCVKTARNFVGHRTHTLSRLATYKVCWSLTDATSCFGADVLAAIDQAINDGVDLIFVSAGESTSTNSEEVFTDVVSIGAFHALARNILLVASAGNDGHTPGSVVNVAPWVFTAASSKTVREGKIKSVAEGQEALSAGAQGVILRNQPQFHGRTLLSEPHVLSTVNWFTPHSDTQSNSADLIPTDLKSGTKIRMSKAKTKYGRKPAPVMASYSSRGPNKVQPSLLLKPDVTAPGVNILAAYSLFPSASNLLIDNRRGVPFNVLQGTSMSCPHVAGIAGLIKTLHPNWSPAAIKSAIMTTASTRDNTNKPIRDAFDKTLANPFAFGSGHIQPNSAIDPGLVYDLSIVDYLNFLCASGYNKQLISSLHFNRKFTCSGSHSITDLNYPSITLPNLGLNVLNITRTVTNVGPPSTYFAKAKLSGYKVFVVPSFLKFKKIGEKKTFRVSVQATKVTRGRKYQFGELKWTNGKHIVRSPITVRRN